jgi:hypothetical protein
MSLSELRAAWRRAWLDGDIHQCRQLESIIARNYTPRSLQRFLAEAARWSFERDEAALVALHPWVQNCTRQYRQAVRL